MKQPVQRGGSPTSRRALFTIVGAIRKEIRSIISIITERTASRHPFCLARSKSPKVPITRKPRRSAVSLANLSSSRTQPLFFSKANAMASLSPLCRVRFRKRTGVSEVRFSTRRKSGQTRWKATGQPKTSSYTAGGISTSPNSSEEYQHDRPKAARSAAKRH